ncbi:hypothetical protein GHT06_019612 [Daphnia sinensis]|uniref:Secreted protein n=1 Tax=Daphnia sinensis TaxID=1820382 RepID=A0AAD5PTA4_9CRUS|nr:hypothetical protein GHT06_019612 [Daphnia sinensis]
MNIYLVFFAIFCLLAQECHAQKYNFMEENVGNCGGKHSRQADVRGNRKQRKEAEIIIADFKRGSLSCSEAPGTLIPHKSVRIDLQDPSGGFERNGKRWRNLQLQLNGPRRKDYPSTVATVLVQCDRTFPVRFIRRAFVLSMRKCVFVWLSHQ